MKKKLALLLLLSTLICIIPTYADNYMGTFPTVRVLMSDSYQDEFGSSHTSVAAADLLKVKAPFKATFNIDMGFSYAYVGPLAMDLCSHSNWYTYCNSTCGTCQNTRNSGHHKNFYKNYYNIVDDISSTGYDFILTLVSGSVCMQDKHGSTHDNKAMGLAMTGGPYALCKQNSGMTQTLRVRTMQHELSHNYGCADHEDNSTAVCIMNGSFDTRPLTITDIWCNSCKNEFDIPIYPASNSQPIFSE